MKKFLFIVLLINFSCSENEIRINESTSGMYFPAIDSDLWETTSVEELNWNSEALVNLYGFLQLNYTRAFIVLKDRKIVLENYWGANIQNTAAT